MSITRLAFVTTFKPPTLNGKKYSSSTYIEFYVLLVVVVSRIL